MEFRQLLITDHACAAFILEPLSLETAYRVCRKIWHAFAGVISNHPQRPYRGVRRVAAGLGAKLAVALLDRVWRDGP
jgi:hypothetical protein